MIVDRVHRYRLCLIRGAVKSTTVLWLWALAFNASALQIGDLKIVRIGTGGTGGIYYPLGTLISEALSFSTENCTADSGCGVSDLLAVAQVSNGSISNIKGIQKGELEAALVQSDIAYWSYTATGIFEQSEPVTALRAVAKLYDEKIHLVVRKDSGIETPRDLIGKRVSLDEPGSGTLVDALLILDAYDIDPAELEKEYIKPEPSGDKLLNNELDAFFHVARAPNSAIERLSAHSAIKIVPIGGIKRDEILQKSNYLSAAMIHDGDYEGVPRTDTIAVSAILAVSNDLDDQLVYEMTKVLWSRRAMKIFDAGHDVSAEFNFRNAVVGLGIPLHPGAKRFYTEQGISVSE